MNLERNVDQEFMEEDNTREKEQRRGERMIFLHTPAQHTCRLRESGGNKVKKNRKKGVISAPKIEHLPSFLSPENSLHRKRENQV